MVERDKQTDRPTDRNIETERRLFSSHVLCVGVVVFVLLLLLLLFCVGVFVWVFFLTSCDR